MTDGRVDAPAPSAPSGYAWTNLFRTFQVALDPRKLLAAAAGILVMSFGWYVLSHIFHTSKPVKGTDYSNQVMQQKLGAKKPDGTDYTEAEYEAEGQKAYDRKLDQWKVLDELAGPDGKLRTLPWNEFRGENPYLFASRVVSQPSATWGEEILTYLSRQIPVLTEPVQKLLVPVIKMIDPRAGFWTRVYLLLCLAWSVGVWAFFGGIITRLAAVQFGGKDRTTLSQATKFVVSRYVSYVLSPIVPLGVIAVIVLCMFLYGLVALIPWVGDIVLYGLLFPLVIVGGIAMAVILLGLVGYPLMYTTISAEGSDTFDAISRSYNYVFQAPWSFLWYSLVALVYGAAVTFVVILVGCLMVLLGKWAMSSAAATVWEPRKPDYLFVYAPESLGWKQLLLAGSDIAVKPEPTIDPDTKRVVIDYKPANPTLSDAYWKDMGPHHRAGAGIVSFWMVLVFLLMIGFSYSYFWSAFTMVYLLMRKKVDEVELDEVYIEEAVPAPPVVPSTPMTAPSGGASLPVVPPPPPATVVDSTPPAVPPTVVSPPPPPPSDTPAV